MFEQAFIEALSVAVAAKVLSTLSAQNGNSIQPRLMDTEQAARYLGLHTASALRQRKCAGQIPESCFVKMGGSVMYDRLKLDEWINQLRDDN